MRREGLDREARTLAQDLQRLSGEARDRGLGNAAREADEEDREHDRDAQKRTADDRMPRREHRDSDAEERRRQRQHGYGGSDAEEARRRGDELDRHGPGLLRRQLRDGRLALARAHARAALGAKSAALWQARGAV